MKPERPGKLRAVFEDEWLVAVVKPAGLQVQPELEALARAQWGPTLVAYHRLDKDTSGLILFGRRPEIHRAMTELFEKKKIRKQYLAIVRGAWRPEWNKVETFVDRQVDGRMANLGKAETATARRATTTFRLLASGATSRLGEISLIEAMPKTGRTHQIRLHCLHQGCPILGDRLYGPERDTLEMKRDALECEHFLALHAYRLDFTHPKSGEPLRLIEPLPAYWTELVRELEATNKVSLRGD